MADTHGIKKIVLSYSGGLDTSVIVPWLRNNYNNVEVVCFCADLGQEEELDGLENSDMKCTVLTNLPNTLQRIFTVHAVEILQDSRIEN